MRKSAILFAFAAILLVSCNKDDKLPVAEFGQSFYSIYSHSSIQIDINLSKPASRTITIPVLTSGTADIGTDYGMSSSEVTIQPGETKGCLTIMDYGLTPDKSITLSFSSFTGYKAGTKYVAVIALDAEEELIYNFTTTGSALHEKVTATLTLEGVHSGTNFRAPEELEIPIVLTGNESGYVVPAADKFVIAKGASSAKMDFTPADNIPRDLPGDVRVVLSVSGSRFHPGDRGTYTIKVESGIQVPARLVGKWVFDHIYDKDELELWFDEGKEDLTLLPLSNKDFTLEFSEDEETGVVTLTPGKTGDFAAYFTETTPIILTTPKNYSSEGIVLGKYTVQEINMFEAEETGAKSQVWTYYKIDANRAFSKTQKAVGNSVIAFRLTEQGGLDMQFRDYDTPPFGTVYWWDPQSFDADLFAFASLFKKAE
jgi:hypothetical protein